MEMQALTDEMQVVEQKVHSVKGKLKSESLEMESLKSQRNEVEKSAKKSESGFNDDRRFVPLYDWYVISVFQLVSVDLTYLHRLTGSLMIHRSMQGLEAMEAISENELRLQYGVEDKHGRSRSISITLIFVPNSRKLAAANVQGMEEIVIDFGDIIEAHLQMNNIRGMLVAILARTREGT